VNHEWDMTSFAINPSLKSENFEKMKDDRFGLSNGNRFLFNELADEYGGLPK
jgi:hypothetical protein